MTTRFTEVYVEDTESLLDENNVNLAAPVVPRFKFPVNNYNSALEAESDLEAIQVNRPGGQAPRAVGIVQAEADEVLNNLDCGR